MGGASKKTLAATEQDEKARGAWRERLSGMELVEGKGAQVLLLPLAYREALVPGESEAHCRW